MTTTSDNPPVHASLSPGDLFRARWAARRAQSAAQIAHEPLHVPHDTASPFGPRTDAAGRPHDSS